MNEEISIIEQTLMKLNPIREKHNKIIKLMAYHRVFNIDMNSNGKIEIEEACDDYYSYELTKDDCIQLSELFKDLSELSL